MITSSDQDKCSMPIQDYLSKVHSRGHPYNQETCCVPGNLEYTPCRGTVSVAANFYFLCLCQQTCQFVPLLFCI